MTRMATTSIDALLQDAVRPVLARVAQDIANRVASLVAAELEKQLAVAERPARKRSHRPARNPGPRRPAGSRPRVEVTSWVADRNARRVPTFVIELTGGLDTKRKIVAKYGEDAAFEKGKPAPKAKAA
jgi:hypothetical protein